MPELPEIEVLCRDLRREVDGQKITDFASRQQKALNMPVQEFAEKVIGQRIGDVLRRAKSVVMRLERGDLWIQLGLDGHLLADRMFDPESGITSIGLENGKGLHIEKAFMGHTHYLGRDDSTARWEEFGVDPFDTDMGIGTFSALTAGGGKTPIKALLTDQSKIAGIGSTYADEILYSTGIHPARSSESILARESGILLDNIKRIMVQSIQDRGARGEWVNLSDTPGHYRLMVHGLGKCGRCGAEVKEITLSGNTAYYCLREQPEPKA